MLGGCTVFVAADAGVDERIAAIAAAQRARIARWQLFAAGVPASLVEHRVIRITSDQIDREPLATMALIARLLGG